ncbi:MAG: hypothetical protein JSV91_08070 [Phycisphaerales bacterium]|nr:MAG: hypothetical protein JSV91_08070 [Phycisphaerales bacterium]
MEHRLGQLLVTRGVLTTAQLSLALERQECTGEPLGLICERWFGVPPQEIEAAWAAQYAGLTRTIDPSVEVYEERALELVTRRQAWQFRILPLRFDTHELMMATTQRHLPRALRFATSVIGVPAFFVLAEPEALGRALCRHYPLPGMTPGSVDDDLLQHYAPRGVCCDE